MTKNKFLTKDGTLKYNQIKALLTITNELWIKVNQIARESGIPSDSFLVETDSIEDLKIKTIFTPNDIVFKVSKRFGANVRERSRTVTVTRARFAACYLLSMFTNLSLMEIGRETGISDHTTVMNAKKRAADFLQSDDDFKFKVNELISEIRSEIPKKKVA